MAFFSRPAVRIALVACALASPFLLPALMTGVLALAAGFIIPPLPLFIGIVLDLLYRPAGYFPYMTLYGLGGMLFVLSVRYFIRTRIM